MNPRGQNCGEEVATTLYRRPIFCRRYNPGFATCCAECGTDFIARSKRQSAMVRGLLRHFEQHLADHPGVVADVSAERPESTQRTLPGFD